MRSRRAVILNRPQVQDSGETATPLPTVSVGAPLVVYGFRRHVAGYNGPLFRLVRASDSATLDIYATSPADNAPDVSGVAAWLSPATSCKSDKRYDQFGSGNDEIQTDDNLRPQFALGNAINGVYGATMTSTAGRYQMPTAITGDAQNCTVVSVVAMSCTNAGCEGMVGQTYNVDGSLTLIPGQSSSSKAQVLTSVSFLSPTDIYRSRTQTQVSIYAFGVTDITFYQDGMKAVKTVNGFQHKPGTWAGGRSGQGGPSYGFNGEMYAKIIYNAKVTDADAALLTDYLNAEYRVITGANAQLVMPGNSIVQGTKATLNMNNPRYMETMLSRPIYVSNRGVFGQLASTQYTNRATYALQFNPALAYNLLHAPESTNDIDNAASGNISASSNGGNGSTAGGGGGADVGTNSWNNHVLPFVRAMKTAGFTVIVPTILPRAWGGNSTDKAEKEAARLAYNALAVANAAAEGYTVADYASLPELAVTSNTTYYADGIHPTSAGYYVMAVLLAGVVNSLI